MALLDLCREGGRSLIRKAADIEFPGWEPTTSSLIAGVEMGEEPEWGRRRDDKGRRRPIGRDGFCLPATRPTCIPDRRARPQQRRAGCGEPGMEAGLGDHADVARNPDCLPCQAAPGRRPPAHNAMAQTALIRSDARTDTFARHDVRTAGYGRAAHAGCRDDVWSGRPLRPRRGTPAAWAPDA